MFAEARVVGHSMRRRKLRARGDVSEGVGLRLPKHARVAHRVVRMSWLRGSAAILAARLTASRRPPLQAGGVCASTLAIGSCTTSREGCRAIHTEIGVAEHQEAAHAVLTNLHSRATHGRPPARADD